MIQVGDLIVEKEYPEDGVGLVIEIDLNKDEGYRLFCNHTTWWYDSSWLRKNCKVISCASG